jgi:sulfur-carrier protein
MADTPGSEDSPVRVEVLLFARAKDLAAGTSSVSLALPKGSTIGRVREALAKSFPALSELLENPSTHIAQNSEFADDAQGVENGDELAVLPPVSGG